MNLSIKNDKMNKILNTKARLNVFNSLVGKYGLTEGEILEQIQLSPHLSSNDIAKSILNKRKFTSQSPVINKSNYDTSTYKTYTTTAIPTISLQSNIINTSTKKKTKVKANIDYNNVNQISYQNYLNDLNIQAQENADLDRAIMNSEEERDKIEARKNQRISELKKDCHIEINLAEEFKSSYFLGKYDNQSYSLLLKTLVNNLDNSIVCFDFDNLNSVVCNCTIERKNIRELVVRLLLLEKQAYKYYPDISMSYIKHISKLMDKASNDYFQDTNTKVNLLVKNKMVSLYDIILEYVNKFEFDLYRMPSPGNSVPDAFIEAANMYPEANINKSGYSVDDDGFEVVNNSQTNNNITSKRKIESWDDISDYDSNGDD